MAEASAGRQSPRVVSYPAHSLCPGEPGLQTAAVVSMGSDDHHFNLSEILSQNYGIREEQEGETRDKEKSLEELEKSFTSQSSDMPFEELLALYGYEASDPISEQESEGNDIAPNLPDMTLDKEQIAKDLLSGEEEEETQSSADDLTPSVTSHDASDLFPNQASSHFLADEDKDPCSSSSSDSEDDSLPSNECKKEIMIGPQYQAIIPALHLNRHNEKVYEKEDQLLWDPNVLPEGEVEEFLYRAVNRQWEEMADSQIPVGVAVKDNEQALYELVKCNFNVEEALRRLQFNVKVIQDELCAWSDEECRNFEHGFRVHGKNFHLIQANKVRTRSVGECVEYYYMWKKSDRFEYFTQQTRFGRKKYVQPGATDFADNDLDSGEVEGSGRSRSSPAVPSATDCLDSTFPQDHLAMESTEPLSVESAACSLGSLSESGQCSTPSEANCSLDPAEESSVIPLPQQSLTPANVGFYPLPAVDKAELDPAPAGRLAVDLALPAALPGEELPLISSHVDLDRDPEEAVAPAQVALSVTDFGLLGIGDVNPFLAAHPACPAPVLHPEPLSHCNVMTC